MDILCNVINMELWSSEGNLQTMLLNKNLENQTNTTTTTTTTTKSKSHNFPTHPLQGLKDKFRNSQMLLVIMIFLFNISYYDISISE